MKDDSNQSDSWAALILAAGKSTRMHSALPKVLHPLCGRALIHYPVQVARASGVRRVAVVVGHGGDQVRDLLGDSVEFVEQREQLGTGHAVLQSRSLFQGHRGPLLVLNGDTPLLRPDTIQRLMARSRRVGTCAVLSFLTASDCPVDGLGRVVRDDRGRVTAIVEEADATPEVRAIKEINVGVYCFDTNWLWPNLQRLRPGRGGETYLVDLVAVAVGAGERVETEPVQDPLEALSINTRLHLARVEAALRQRIRQHWMLEGVTIVDPASTYIDADVEFGRDVTVYPNTMLYRKTRIGSGSVIGPNSIIIDSTIGEQCKVLASVVENSTTESHVDIGPFSHLRNQAHIEANVHIGNFVEVKKSRLGQGSKSGHFSYIGDATIGRDVNVGAGTITCNFDGVKKNETIIEDEVFIGCDTMLVAPVRVGTGAKTGAGAVVTRDVPPHTVVAGVPARPLKKKSREKASSSRRKGKARAKPAAP